MTAANVRRQDYLERRSDGRGLVNRVLFMMDAQPGPSDGVKAYAAARRAVVHS